MFLVDCCVCCLWLVAIKFQVHFLLSICVLLSLTTQPLGWGPPACFITRTPPLAYPCYRTCWLLVGCCVLLLNNSHIRPRPHPSLYFLMWLNSFAWTKEPTGVRAILMPRTCYVPLGNQGTMIWGHRGPTCGERGQSCWRVGRWQFMLVVVCGCVELWLVVGYSNFTHFVEHST